MQKAMRKLIVVFVVGALIALSGCSFSTIYLLPGNPTDVKGNKVGEQKVSVILGIFPFHRDLSVYKAARNGGIKRISTVDYRVSIKFFGLVREYKVIVTGE